MSKPSTKDQIRAALKAGFYAGFQAARAVSVDGAWEECRLRWELDYPKRFGVDSLSSLPESEKK